MDGDDLELHDVLNLVNNVNNQNNLINLEYLQLENEQHTYNRKYHVRKRMNPLEEFDDEEFKIRFRFSKDEVKHLFEMINGSETLDPKVRIYENIYCSNYVCHETMHLYTFSI